MAHGVIIREIPSQDAVNYRFAQHTAALDNGQVVALKELVSNEREIWKVETPAAGDELWVVTGVELMYDEKKQIGDYTNEAGQPFRCERAVDMTIAISKDALAFGTGESTDMVVGASVIGTAATKLTLKAAAATGDKVYGKVIDVYTRGGIKFAAIQFAHAVVTATANG